MDTEQSGKRGIGTSGSNMNAVDNGKYLTGRRYADVTEKSAEREKQKEDREIADDIKRVDPDQLDKTAEIKLEKAQKIIFGNDIILFNTLTILFIACKKTEFFSIPDLQNENRGLY